MATKFGKTWWGSEWLRSLTNIDYENRIPRGARYARNGSVRKVEIRDNVISAKVQGSRPSPYSVTVRVNKFTQKEIDSLMDGILGHPAIVAELLNRKLSPAVYDIARQKNLKVFPSTWRDLGMNCSCPDWAVPCKHIAAVIYMVGQEIDNNPFLIFKLHGVDILDELQKRGISINAENISDVPDWRDAFGLIPRVDVILPPLLGRVGERLPSFDFSKIARLGDAIRKLLPPSPVFYSGDNFMQHYEENAKRMAKAATYLLNGKKYVYEALSTNISKLPKRDITDIVLTIDKKHNASIHFNGYKTKYSIVDLMEYLSSIPAEKVYDSSNIVFAFRTCYILALHLAAKGNVVPVIGKQKDGSVEIIWTPFMSDKQTAEILSQTDNYFSKDNIIIEPDSRGKFAPTSPAWFVTSCFITSIIHCTEKRSTWNDKIYDLFYIGGTYKFEDVGEKNIPGSIKSWTDHLSAPQLRYLPIIMVRDESEDGSEFLLEMAVSDSEAKELRK